MTEAQDQQKLEALKRHVEAVNQMALDEMAVFRKDLHAQEDVQMAHAIEWMDSMAQCAAKVEIFSRVLAWFNREDPVALQWIETVDEIDHEALRIARHPSRSTSPFTNVMAHERGKVWANLLREVRKIERRANRAK
jgi:hypothetical protein